MIQNAAEELFGGVFSVIKRMNANGIFLVSAIFRSQLGIFHLSHK